MKTLVPPTPKVILRAPHTALGWLVLAKAVYSGLSNNKGMFTTPNPPLAQFSTDIDSLDTAQTATQTRTKGTAAARDAKLVIVRADLIKVCAYVQALVNADAANAATLAHNAGLALRKTRTGGKSEVAAKPGKVPGLVLLTAKLGTVKAAHEWQTSADGKTWTDFPTTLQAKTSLSGLTPGSTVFVRHRAVTKTGPLAWSQPVSMIVV